MWSRVSLLLLLVAAVANGRPFGVFRSSLTTQSYDNSLLSITAIEFRGGASSVVADEDEDIDLDESDEEASDAEEEEAATKKMGTNLATSAVKAADKSKSKKVSRAKSAVNAGLAEIPKKSSKKKKSKKFGLPYIVKVCMNPLTVFAMTKAYFASLFNLDYIKKDTSQDLRSALEEKAKKATGGGSRGKRKMKPGQAKTLSDLPQLNT